VRCIGGQRWEVDDQATLILRRDQDTGLSKQLTRVEEQPTPASHVSAGAFASPGPTNALLQ